MTIGSLSGKVALVLGVGEANIGRAIAARFAVEGARVIVAGRNTASVERAGRGLAAAAMTCDIASPTDIAMLVGDTRRRFGKLDIAVNATGLNSVTPFLDVKPDELRRVTAVQFTGVFHFLQEVLRVIEDGGSIIQISSVSATALLPDHAAYMATKAAGDVLVRSAAAEFGSRGVRINSIAPGPTSDTPMAQAMVAKPEVLDRIRQKMPLGRLGTAADIAEAALWLVGDRCFITGEVLQVNGGRAIPRLG